MHLSEDDREDERFPDAPPRTLMPHGITVPEYLEYYFMVHDGSPAALEDDYEFDEYCRREARATQSVGARRHRFLRKHRRHESFKDPHTELPETIGTRWMAGHMRKWYGPPRHGSERVSGSWKDISRRGRQYRAN